MAKKSENRNLESEPKTLETVPVLAEPVVSDSSSPEHLAGDVGNEQLAKFADAPIEDSAASVVVSLARQAYELMTERLGSALFDPWDDLSDFTRGAFKERAAAIEALPAFERCAAILLISAELPQ